MGTVLVLHKYLLFAVSTHANLSGHVSPNRPAVGKAYSCGYLIHKLYL